MAGVNKAIIVGHLGRDPEFRTLENGSNVCRLSVATTRSWTNKTSGETQEETEWHRITVWGKQAEHCNNYLSTGRQVYVEGRLRTSSYDDGHGGKKYSTEIVADRVQFLGGKGEGGGGGSSEGGGNSGGGSSSGGGGNRNTDPKPSHDPDDDIPF